MAHIIESTADWADYLSTKTAHKAELDANGRTPLAAQLGRTLVAKLNSCRGECGMGPFGPSK